MTLSNDVLTELMAEMDANPSLAIASPVLVRDGLIAQYSWAKTAKEIWQIHRGLD